jgi:hypothetical protein
VICEDFQCATRDGVADDQACDATIEADDCGAFQPVFCNGQSDQQPPHCPTSCLNDQECDPEAHCAGSCQPDVADGGACEEDSDCTSGHCNAGVCCSSGACCRTLRDCPGYATPPTCVDPRTCQGRRIEATCNDFVCGSTMTEDDSACAARPVPAQSCDLYRDVVCNGLASQIAVCVFRCATDQQCDANAHCAGSSCVSDLPNGQRCDEASDCVSNHCTAGICCSRGDCCTRDSDCPTGAFSCNEATFVCDVDNRLPQAGRGG